MSKYNNYVGGGGDGVNRVAILDPNATMADPILPTVNVMKEILTLAGPTPDSDFTGSGYPNAVREWCINTAAVDPFTHSVLINNEDGKMYRWDLNTNTISQRTTLTPGIGEAYTPTIIGVDGTPYAINNATLFALGHVIHSDMDCDDDVDDADVSLFLACMTGPNAGAPVGDCASVDFDHDNDVDQSDFGVFQRCMSGPGVAANPACESL
jgi:hypothetical protein